MDLNNSEMLGEWEKWKKTLSKAVNVGRAVGMSGDTIDNIGYRIGNFLSAAVDPENREQRVLQELWKSGDDEDRRSLAKMIVKMVETENK